MRIKRAYRAFTLIELLVVIAIIALLLSIVVPSIAKAKEYAKRTICMNNVRQSGMGIHLYAEDNDQHIMANYQISNATIADPPSFMPDPYNSYMVYHPEQTKSDGTYRPFHLAVLYDQGYIDVPKTFYCPAQSKKLDYPIKYYYEFYVGQGEVSDYSNPSAHMGSYEWGTILPADTRSGSELCRTSYNYWVYGQSKIEKIGSYRPILVDNIQEWEVVPHRKSRGVDSRPQGLTALYVDGHVSFCNDEELFDDQYWPRDYTTVGSGPGNTIADFEQVLKLMNGQ